MEDFIKQESASPQKKADEKFMQISYPNIFNGTAIKQPDNYKT